MNPSGHTRCPRYVRGARGVVEHVHEKFIFPDANAHGRGECPEVLYTVGFDATELWGNGAEGRGRVYVDLWDSYLEPAARRCGEQSGRRGLEPSGASERASDDERRPRSRRRRSSSATTFPDRSSRARRRIPAAREGACVSSDAIDRVVSAYEKDIGPLNGATRGGARVERPAFQEAPARGRHGGAARARHRRAARRAHGGRREHRQDPQRRRLHALLLLSVAGARAAAGLVQEPAVSFAHGEGAAGGARRVWRGTRPVGRGARVGLERGDPLPRPADAPQGHGGHGRGRAREARHARLDDRRGDRRAAAEGDMRPIPSPTA